MNDTKQLNVKEIRNEMRIVGLRRTGNHGILNWIIRQAEPPVTHYNDVDPESPYDDSARATATDPNAERLNWMVYSLEDMSLAVLGDASSYPRRSHYSEISVDRRVDVIILRDPFNLIASRFRRGGDWGHRSIYVSGLSVSQLWITYAREFLGYTNWLPHNRIGVSYNKWCVSEEYRRDLAQKLGLHFTDMGFQDVSRYGGGSSFDGTGMNGNAQGMSTNQRWQLFRNDNSFRALFRDPLLLDLAEEIFDFDDELTAFIRDTLRPKASRVDAFDRWWRIALIQRAIARLRRFSRLRRVYGKTFRESRAKKMPLHRPGN